MLLLLFCHVGRADGLAALVVGVLFEIGRCVARSISTRSDPIAESVFRGERVGAEVVEELEFVLP